MLDKTCIQCGKGFRVSPSHHKQKFCSHACKKDANNVEMVCQHCGVKFLVNNSVVAAGGGKFCSKPCHTASMIDPTKEKSKHRPKRDKVEKVKKVCVVCMSEFEVYPSRKDTAKTCSVACADQIRNVGKIKERVVLKCEQCGKDIVEHECHADRRRFCSKDCLSASEAFSNESADRVSGDKNPMWNGGLTEHSAGYIYQAASGHPMTSTPYVFQHRLVIENAMRSQAPDHPFLVEINGQKYLRQEIHVHHKDEDKRNNRISNLMAITPEAHARLHNGSKYDPWEFWEPKL